MTKRIGAATLILSLFGGLAHSDTVCQGVDLRRPDLNRPYLQHYLNADCTESDTRFCATFSSTLLISQQLGVSVSAIDRVFQNAMLRTSNPKMSRPGFCKQENIDKYFGKPTNNFVQAFADFIHKLEPKVEVRSNAIIEMNVGEQQKISQWLDAICGERIPERGFDMPSADLKSKDYTGPTQIRPGYTMMSESEMGEKIDQLLNAGQFVQYTHGFHAVTIVGRTADCRYIVQDSIAESYWKAEGPLMNSGGVYADPASALKDQAQITYENQVFQYWPRAILLKNASRISYVNTCSDRLQKKSAY